MGNFNRDNNKFGGGKGGKKFGSKETGKRSYGNREGRPPMHKAVCGDCGQDCEVPFKPFGNKPVLCNSCFKNNGDDDSRKSGNRAFEKRGFEKRDGGRPTMHKAICDTCGKGFEVPFKPSADKTLYCNQCFGKTSVNSAPSNKNVEQFKEQFETLNAKLDKIFKILASLSPAKALPVEKEIQKTILEIDEVKTPKAKKSMKK